MVAFAPDDRRDEFSYVAEHVTHDGAIGALLSCAAVLRETAKHLQGPWDRYQKWIDTELGRLWKLRGPCPGLGAALTAFEIELGVFVAYDLAKQVGENEDPWPVVDRMFQNPASVLSPAASRFVGKEHQQVWIGMSNQRRALLKLLSRFEITPEQATLAFVEEERASARLNARTPRFSQTHIVFEILEKRPNHQHQHDRPRCSEARSVKKHPLPEPSFVATALTFGVSHG